LFPLPAFISIIQHFREGPGSVLTLAALGGDFGVIVPLHPAEEKRELAGTKNPPIPRVSLPLDALLLYLIKGTASPTTLLWRKGSTPFLPNLKEKQIDN